MLAPDDLAEIDPVDGEELTELDFRSGTESTNLENIALLHRGRLFRRADDCIRRRRRSQQPDHGIGNYFFLTSCNYRVKRSPECIHLCMHRIGWGREALVEREVLDLGILRQESFVGPKRNPVMSGERLGADKCDVLAENHRRF